MNTQEWGPSLWNYTFMMCRNYPEVLDNNNKEHKRIRKSTIAFYRSFPDILPCKYCRASFKIFIKELPIENYLEGRDNLTYWLYLIKDKVNNKLINQERKSFQEEVEALDPKKITVKKINDIKKRIFVTVPTPPFCDVVDHYEQFRAGCSPKSLSCREKIEKK